MIDENRRARRKRSAPLFHRVFVGFLAAWLVASVGGAAFLYWHEQHVPLGAPDAISSARVTPLPRGGVEVSLQLLERERAVGVARGALEVALVASASGGERVLARFQGPVASGDFFWSHDGRLWFQRMFPGQALPLGRVRADVKLEAYGKKLEASVAVEGAPAPR